MGITLRLLQRIALVIAACFAAAGSQPASAQSDYPNKPVRLVVGFTPGSVADITGRVLGNRMGQILGQQFVIENKPGAGSNLAAEFVARVAEGRLHAVPLGLGQRQQRGDGVEPVVRYRQGLRAGRPDQRGRGDPGGASIGRREQREGADRARQVEARRTHLCLDRHRQRAAHVRRAVHAEHRRPSSCTCPTREPAGGDRPARRPRPGDVLAGDRRDLAGEVRPAQGAGELDRQARVGPAGGADHDRGRHAGLRHLDLVRAVGARGHAARGDREAVACGAGGAEIARGDRGLGSAGRRSDARQCARISRATWRAS